jgi:hypothetical protein
MERRRIATAPLIFWFDSMNNFRRRILAELIVGDGCDLWRGGLV